MPTIVARQLTDGRRSPRRQPGKAMGHILSRLCALFFAKCEEEGQREARGHKRSGGLPFFLTEVLLLQEFDHLRLDLSRIVLKARM